MYLNATVTEAAGGNGVVAKGLRRATKDEAYRDGRDTLVAPGAGTGEGRA